MPQSEAQQQLRPKLDLLEPKTDSANLMARIEALERAVDELKRRGQ